jgi:Kdo2-lipid IVA lauroyltransferase/acyltransferase
MNPRLTRLGLSLRRGFKKAANSIIGFIAVAILKLIRRGDRVRFANTAGALMRRVGPLLPKHKVGRANLRAAFPEKSPAEIEAILAGVWDNLGRVAAEFAHLDRLRIADSATAGDADVASDPDTLRRVEDVRRAPRPTAAFAAHLANWELPALASARLGFPATILFRPPNVRAVADAVIAMRAGCMGTLIPSGFDAPIRLAKALEHGGHVAMLVDQHEFRGVDVTFFGRTCKANPLIAQLARHTNCFVRGIRVVRLPDGNHFRGELTEPLDLPRDAQGEVDIQGTMQLITSVIEGWVREHPEQWLWLHRRWR